MVDMSPALEVQGHANSSGNDALAKLFTESLDDHDDPDDHDDHDGHVDPDDPDDHDDECQQQWEQRACQTV